MNTPVLSPEQLEHFAEQGYVRVSAALSPAFVARVQAAIWEQLKTQYGMLKDVPHTWRAERGLVNKDRIDRSAGVEVGERLVGAVNQLLGEGRWRPLKTLGALLLTNLARWGVTAVGAGGRLAFRQRPSSLHGSRKRVDALYLLLVRWAARRRHPPPFRFAPPRCKIHHSNRRGGNTRWLAEYRGLGAVASVACGDAGAQRSRHSPNGNADGSRSRCAWRTGSDCRTNGRTRRRVSLSPGDAPRCQRQLFPLPRIMRRTNFRRKI